ncbi:hypothetical protein B0H15DRAFT_873246 [Mycena belliarum]|uniref:Uncharacterized protein n=1 Tax=Mycena belliarum TaxID=1033014 RepID=A0AAD6TLW2_9AGAR|nr:hypothetical protein B0H15DRAFT_873246 [Mycena belliae]
MCAAGPAFVQHASRGTSAHACVPIADHHPQPKRTSRRTRDRVGLARTLSHLPAAAALIAFVRLGRLPPLRMSQVVRARPSASRARTLLVRARLYGTLDAAFERVVHCKRCRRAPPAPTAARLYPSFAARPFTRLRAAILITAPHPSAAPLAPPSPASLNYRAQDSAAFPPAVADVCVRARVLSA